MRLNSTKHVHSFLIDMCLKTLLITILISIKYFIIRLKNNTFTVDKITHDEQAEVY